MKVVAIMGGLGSQMFKYAFYLMIKNKVEVECYIDTSYYLQKNSWNGYELQKVFGIHAPDFKDQLSDQERKIVMQRKSNYVSVTLKRMLKNGKCNSIDYYFLGHRQRLHSYFFCIEDKVRFVFHKYYMGFGKYAKYPKDILCSENSYFDEYPHNSDHHIERIKDQILSAFHFPEFDDNLNKSIALEMNNTNSVAIHVRRSDHLGDNGKLFERCYYLKSVNYIKKHDSKNLKFYIFSEDLDWCKTNEDQLGLSKFDDIKYVNWNSGDNSFRDMQLMTYCKHNVLAISSFSWWGYYLSKRKNKIVCSPEGHWLEVLVHF